jgi:effector-binding domain-containing protein
MSNTKSTDAVGLTRTMDTLDAITDIMFDNESFDIRLDRAVVAAKQAKADADAAAKHLADLRAEILSMMQQSNLAIFQCPNGTVTVCKGRRTVSVTDPALKAEISLIKERGVRTGRCTEKTGDPYVTIK